MKRLEVLGPLVVLVLRAIAVPWREWAGDWIVVFGLLWGALIFTEQRPGPRKAALAAASLWLLAIYAWHQGPHTFRLAAG